MDSSITAEQVSPRRMEVRIRGSIGATDVVELSQRLLPNDMTDGWELLVDLTGVESFDTGTRQELQTLQRALATREVRTAFVADRPRVRGLALWIAHTSNDPFARPFHRRAQAEGWLASREGRLENLLDYLEQTKGNARPPPKETPSQRMKRLRKRRRSSEGGDE